MVITLVSLFDAIISLCLVVLCVDAIGGKEVSRNRVAAFFFLNQFKMTRYRFDTYFSSFVLNFMWFFFFFFFFFSHNEVLHFATIYTMLYLHWNEFPHSVVHFAIPHTFCSSFAQLHTIVVLHFQVRCHFLIKIIIQFRQLILDYILLQLILMKSNEERGSDKTERYFCCYQLTKTVLLRINTIVMPNIWSMSTMFREAVSEWRCVASSFRWIGVLFVRWHDVKVMIQYQT